MKCYLDNGNLTYLFSKVSTSKINTIDKKKYRIYTCDSCGLWQLNPLPAASELKILYQDSYFKKRTDRGYDNYDSNETKILIEDTLKKNLQSLNLHVLEKKINLENKTPMFLEIGSASGHFLQYMKQRGWKEYGVDIAYEMVKKGQQKQLNIYCIDFLDPALEKKLNYQKFNAVFLWATLEHLPNFMDYLHKIHQLLDNQGELYLSTCHTGFWAKKNKLNWRYLNVPEHIFYFNKKSLEVAFLKSGFKIQKIKTYGSGFTSYKNMHFLYRIKKRIYDFSAKFFSLGDMIIYNVKKV